MICCGQNKEKLYMEIQIKEVYSCIIEDLHKLEAYRDFKDKNTSTSNQIKDNASIFADNFYNGFQNISDKLLNTFDLN